MKAIQTKVLYATNTKPTRIKASAEGVDSITRSRDSIENDLLDRGLPLNTETIHHWAASRFAQHLSWLDGKTHLVSGGLPDGSWSHCFVR